VISALLLDFDGVLIDSDPVKDAAFEYIFREYPNQFQDFLPFHRENGGVSRYEKIRYFHEKLLGESIDEKKVNEVAQEFSDYVLEQLCQPRYLIEDSCSRLPIISKIIPIHIVSASDEIELKKICEAHKISPYFRSIHGSPGTKSEIVGRVFEQNSYSKKNTVLVGDSINDFLAAREHGIKFFGYNSSRLEAENCDYLSGFSELCEFLESNS
jgi:phosphoglycolate phosphatase-like HAD superfamily hydrolase